jgi:hypothetical protein
LKEEMASLKLEASAATSKAQRYRTELKDAQASLANTRLPENDAMVSLVAENAALKRNISKMVKDATAADSKEAALEFTRLKAKLATLEAENQVLLAEVDTLTERNGRLVQEVKETKRLAIEMAKEQSGTTTKLEQKLNSKKLEEKFEEEKDTLSQLEDQVSLAKKRDEPHIAKEIQKCIDRIKNKKVEEEESFAQPIEMNPRVVEEAKGIEKEKEETMVNIEEEFDESRDDYYKGMDLVMFLRPATLAVTRDGLDMGQDRQAMEERTAALEELRGARVAAFENRDFRTAAALKEEMMKLELEVTEAAEHSALESGAPLDVLGIPTDKRRWMVGAGVHAAIGDFSVHGYSTWLNSENNANDDPSDEFEEFHTPSNASPRSNAKAAKALAMKRAKKAQSNNNNNNGHAGAGKSGEVWFLVLEPRGGEDPVKLRVTLDRSSEGGSLGPKGSKETVALVGFDHHGNAVVFEKMSKSEGRPNIGTALRRWADAWGKYRTYRQRLVEVSELVKFRGSEIHKLEAALLEVKSAMEKETEEHNKLKSSLDYAGDKILNLETALENSRKRLENAERY